MSCGNSKPNTVHAPGKIETNKETFKDDNTNGITRRKTDEQQKRDERARKISPDVTEIGHESSKPETVHTSEENAKETFKNNNESGFEESDKSMTIDKGSREFSQDENRISHDTSKTDTDQDTRKISQDDTEIGHDTSKPEQVHVPLEVENEKETSEDDNKSGIDRHDPDECVELDKETVKIPRDVTEIDYGRSSKTEDELVPEDVQNENPNFEDDNKRERNRKESWDYTEIDQHAREAPESLKNSAEKLVEYLSIVSTDPRMLTRGFFVWISENIRYDVEGFFGKANKAPTDAESAMRYGRSVCAGYAGVFELLCSKAGIPEKKISGFSKGYRYSPTQPISLEMKTSHAWNAVQLEGKWYLLDCTWGAGHVDRNKKFTKKFDDFFFLTEPKQFLTAHFPYMGDNLQESKKWQLLANPISLDEFNKKIRYDKQAFKLGVHAVSHKQPYFEMKNELEITFKSTKEEIELTAELKLEKENILREQTNATYSFQGDGDYKILVHPRQTGIYTLNIFGRFASGNTNLSSVMKYKFKCTEVSDNYHQYPRSNPVASKLGMQSVSHTQPYFEMQNELQMTFKLFGKEEIELSATLKFKEKGETQFRKQENATFCYQENDMYTILVHPRSTGLHVLDISEKLASDEKSKFSWIRGYTFKCTKVIDKYHQYPRSNPVASKLGLQTVSHKKPYFEMKNELQMTFKLFEKEKIELSATLKFEEKGETEFRKQENATFCYQENDMYTILVHPRSTGLHKLDIFRKITSDERSVLSWIMGYTFKCNKVTDKYHQYPISNPVASKLGLQTVSHKKPYFEMKNEIQMTFKLIGKEEIELSAILKFDEEGETQFRKQENATFCYQENGMYTILVHPRSTGLHKLDIFRKITSDERSVLSLIMGYKFKCTEVTDKYHQYPRSNPTAFKLGFQPVSHKKPYFEMKNEIQMTFKLFGKEEIELSATLKYEEGETQFRKQENATFCYQENDMYTILVHPRETGMHVLDISGKLASDEKSKFSWIMGYTFKCTEMTNKHHRYPISNPTAFKLGLQPVSHKKPYFEMKNELQMTFKLFEKEDIELSAILKFGGGGETQYKKQENATFCCQENDMYTIRVHPRTTGMHVLDIFEKVASDNKSKLSWIMGYTFKCTEVTDVNHEYPEIFGKCSAEKCVLHEPLNGYLPANTDIQFCISSPLLHRVIVASPHNTYLNKQGTKFMGKITTPDKGHKVNMFGARDDDFSSMVGLYGFHTV